MDNHNLSVWTRPKSLGLTLLLALGLPMALCAEQMPSTTMPSGESDKAMAQYIQAATQQLDGYRQAINVYPPLPNEDAQGIAKDKLVVAQELLAKLKNVGPSKFDAVKTQYEHARDALAQAVQAALKP